MDELNKLLTNARTTEVDSLTDSIISEFDSGDWSSDAHLTGIINILKPESERLTRAINRIKAESNLEEMDEVRDNRVRAIYYLVTGLIYHPDEAVSTAGKNVDAVLRNYGISIVEESYAVESSLIESLLLSLNEPELHDSIEALTGLSALITRLSNAQSEFAQAQLDFEKEKAEEGTEDNATTIKKEVVSIINDKLVTYLRAMIQVDETKYGAFTRTVARVIDDMNSAVKKRRNK